MMPRKQSSDQTPAQPVSPQEPEQSRRVNGHTETVFDMEAWKASFRKANPEAGPPPEPEPAESPGDWRTRHNERVAATRSRFLKPATEVHAQNIDWTWRHRLGRRMLHLIAGHPGTGKSTIAFDWAAKITSGGTFPGGAVAPVGKVAIWSGEDDYAQVIKPRLMAAGADMENVFFIDSAPQGKDGKPVAFDPAEHMELLAQELGERPDISMIIFDPIVSAVKGDSHKNSEVRRGLQALVDLLEKHDIVGVGVTHLTKGTAGRVLSERVTGSLAFGAMARVVFLTVKDAQGQHRLIVGKCNVAPDGGGYAYQIKGQVIEGIETSGIEWGELIAGDGKALMDEAEQAPRTGRPSKAGAALALLRALMANGPRLVSDIQKAAEEADLSIDTLRRAGKPAGLKSGPVDAKDPRSPHQWWIEGAV